MLEIFFFFFISSFFSVLYGRLFFKLSGIDVKKQNLGFSEQGIFGIILLGFIALFLNFFTKLDQLICTIVLILSLIQIFFEIKSYNQKIIKKFFYHSIIISFFCSIFIAYDNVYRPDAGIYHLPYTKIINDFKIFFGVVTLNPVFGLTNIMQYVSAIFNNYLFKDVGITIPLALLSIYFIEYFVRQILSKKIDIYYKFFLFLIITFIFLEMNRYSEYGNHNPGHLALFYLFTLFFRKDFDLKNDENFKLLTLLCLFIFLNKITFVLVLFIPIAIWLKNKFYLKIKYFPFFSIIFLSIWFLKNLAISGCVVYPVKFTCNDNFEWYSNESKFIIASENIQQFGELHARRWSKINDYKNFDHNRLEKENYLRSFNWIRSDDRIKSMKFGFFKLFNNYIFIILIIFFILLIGKKTKEINDKNKLGFNQKVLLTTSILSTFIIYYNVPVGRLGTSFIVILIYFIFYFIFKNKINIFAQNKIKKIITSILILTGTIFITKNISKIFVNYNVKFHNSPWPRIYENQKDISSLSSNSNKPVNYEYELKNNVLKVYYVNKLSYWRPDKREEKCLYNKSPCAQSGLNFDNFDVKKNSFDYFMIKLRK